MSVNDMISILKTFAEEYGETRRVESVNLYYSGILIESGRSKFFYSFETEKFTKHSLDFEPKA